MNAAQAELRVLLFPGGRAYFADAECDTECGTLDLSHGIQDLFFGEFRPLHRSTPFVEDRRSRHPTLVLMCRRFRGKRQAPALKKEL